MEEEESQEETTGLRSVERSNLRGAQSSRSRATGAKRPVRRRERPASPPTDSGEARRPARSSGKKKRVIIFALLIVAVGFFLVTTTFSTATLRLTLASASVTIDGVFSAIREPAQSTGISYSKRGPYTETLEATITDITKERKNTRAEGMIVVHNTNPSGSRLDLVNRTRFKTKDGKIYRLVGKQSVPGGKTVGGEFSPGRKTVKVLADRVGDQYNLPEKGTRFSVPGLAGNREFSDSYALSETPIVGGFSGERFIPNPEEESRERERLRRDIERSLRDTLAQALDTNTLSERIVFEGGIFITYEPLESEQTDDSVIIREKGVLYAISFREADLASFLSRYAPSSVPSGVRPTRITADGLTMEMEKDDGFDVVSSTEFSFRLSGVADLFWSIDDRLFLSDVVGKERAEVETILMNQYPQVTRVNSFSIFPVWRSTMPGNKDKITIHIEHTDPQSDQGPFDDARDVVGPVLDDARDIVSEDTE